MPSASRPGPGIPLLALLLSALIAPRAADAQAPSPVLVRTLDSGPSGRLAVDRGAAGLWQRLQKLTTTASVLYTAGHPDDEEAGVLTLLGRGMGVRTALLTLNRGEGGANAIGPELFDALGLVRSEELRLAGRYYGLDDQYFTTAVDYGYSKTLDEAFRSWDRDAVLADMVRVIRLNRPLVVISRWHGSARDGHGHHQASGVLTPEAVRAAADPTRFPDQLTHEGLRVWRVPKVYRGRIEGGERWNVEIDPHVWSPWLGTSYEDFGSFGLSLQRSQTSGRQRSGRGRAPTRYERLSPAGTEREAGIFDGLDVTLSGVFDQMDEPTPAAARNVLTVAEGHIAEAIAAFTMTAPGAVAPHLARARAALDRALEETPAESDAAFTLRVERAELDDALAAALGLELQATASAGGAASGAPLRAAVPGQEIDVHVSFAVRGAETVALTGVTVESRDGWSVPGTIPGRSVATGGSVVGTLPLSVPPDAEPSRPWFHRASVAENTYAVRDSSEIHLGESRPRLRAVATVEYGGSSFEIEAPVRTVESLAPYGTARHPLEIAPALSLTTERSAAILRSGVTTVPITVDVASHAHTVVDAVVDLELPAGWTSSPSARELRFDGPGQTERVAFVVTTPATPRGTERIGVRARAEERSYREGYRRISHRDLAPTYLYGDAALDVVPVDVRVAAGLRTGYVMGVGDAVPDAIGQLGVEVRLLGAEDLAGGDLSAFDAIVIGTRAYAVRPDLVANNGRLLDYAREGGHLVVLYQTPEYTPASQAPYLATLPGNAEEVSEEDAPVVVLAPAHPLLSAPNRIDVSDFDDWIEQRGSKFFATWASEYTPLIETHDTGQPPQSGVWLSADVGRGHFTYVSLALHRQLPYGVPGAYRILANLLSLGR